MIFRIAQLSLIILIFSSSAFLVIQSPIPHLSPHPDSAKSIIGFVMGHGSLVPMTSAERSHLIDVRSFLHILKVVWLFSLLCFMAVLYKVKNLSHLIRVPAVIALALSTLMGFLAVPFAYVFQLFHSIFFLPGTYLFPADSVLISVFPEIFFRLAFISILLTASSASAVLLMHASRREPSCQVCD